MKQTTKRIITFMLACAMAFTMMPANVSKAAAVKLNKTKLSIYEEETATLKLKGAKKVTFTSSNKKIASVDKKGVVTGVKKGNCNITAKDAKTGKKYVCKVTVKAAKIMKIEDAFISKGGNSFWYRGSILKGASYYMDGKKLKVKTWDADDDGYAFVSFKAVKDGKHVFEIKKKGYKTYTFKFEYTAPKELFVFEPFVRANDNAPILILQLNPKVKEDDDTKVFKIDGNEAVITNDLGINGDGIYCLWLDATGLEQGTHTVTVKVDGFDEETKEFTVE